MINPYQAKYYAYELSKKASADSPEKFGATLLDAKVELNPHQIEAALFAFKSPYSKGAILGDEVGLGKTIEAGILLSQTWAEGNRRILIICPSALRKQWLNELADKFYLKAEVLDNLSYNKKAKSGVQNPFDDNSSIKICSYQYARKKAEQIQLTSWDLVVLDEAHYLRNAYKYGNQTAKTVQQAIRGYKKILLTATPLQNRLDELYGLVSFIDPDIFGDIKSFRKNYVLESGARDIEGLKERLSSIVHRTLRRDVKEFINYRARIPITQQFIPSRQELDLYEMVLEYLRQDHAYAFPEYAKSILFDYSYKYFYEDGYGKDYRILNLKDGDQSYRNLYLTANLISFYQQQLIFKEQKQLLRDFLLHKPLWIFVGGKVNAVRSEGGKKVSDVLEIIYFLTDFLKKPAEAIRNIDEVINNKAGLIDKNGYSIFETSFSYLAEQNLSAEAIFTGINELVFNNSTIGANLYLDNLKGAEGELGLRVGDSDYFGVINVGDEKTLYDFAVSEKVLGNEPDFSESLFKRINEDSSKINLLIGSKKFTEGWSSWRVSSMGLMNVGKSEGSQIIQLFGRGVRLKGYNFSLKRSTGLDDYQKPADIRKVRPYLRHLETLQIFGVQANYMEQFKEFLEEEGLPTNDSSWITIKVPTVQKNVVGDNKLKLIRVKETQNFKKQVILPLTYDPTKFDGKLVEIDWYPKIDVLQKQKNNAFQQKETGVLTQSHLSLIDWNSLYLVIQNYKADKAYHNLAIGYDQIKDILSNVAWYKILIPATKLSFDTFSNVFIWQELAETLLKKYIEQYYLYYKNEFHSDHIEAVVLNRTDDNFIAEYDFRLNTEEDIDLYQKRVEQLKIDVLSSAFSEVQIASDAYAFDNLLHLYKPLVYLGKNLQNRIQVSPIALDSSERRFLNDLIAYVMSKPPELDDKEIHVLRNQSKKGLGFFTDGNNFYPDFIVWVIQGDKQFIKFVDPKGIRNSKGINDPKIQFHKVLKNKIQPQIGKSGIFLDSYIVSNSALLEINWKGNLKINDFNAEHVYFQKENADDYIKLILSVL